MMFGNKGLLKGKVQMKRDPLPILLIKSISPPNSLY